MHCDTRSRVTLIVTNITFSIPHHLLLTEDRPGGKQSLCKQYTGYTRSTPDVRARKLHKTTQIKKKGKTKFRENGIIYISIGKNKQFTGA